MRTIKLADYLRPRGHLPYNQLYSDMEIALEVGQDVQVISVPGFLMAFGHVKMKKYGCPWSDGQGRFYASARDCIDRKNAVEQGYDSVA